jgi:two-component system, NarL family, nitrate/nitrite response regulator NarL
MDFRNKITVGVCDTQPITAEGLKTVLDACSDLEHTSYSHSLSAAADLLRRSAPDIVVIDKAFGIHAVLEWITETHARHPQVALVVWGVSLTEAEALRFLQSGARGIVRKTSPVNLLLSCLRAVAAGRNWMEDSVFKDALRSDRYPRSELTPREQQVLELVEQGFKNREIALELGIRPGTVKIHLKHIFEKTGVRGRYGLALNGLRDRGTLSLTA